MTESSPPEESRQEPPSYQQMPEYRDRAEPGTEGRPALPSEVLWSSRILYVLSALSFLSAILAPTSRDQIRDGLRENYPDRSESELNDLAGQFIVGSVVVSLILAVLCGLLAWKIPQGANWARITATVLLAINLFFGVLGLAAGGTGLLTLLAMAISLIALILLWRRSASEFFSEMATRRRVR